MNEWRRCHIHNVHILCIQCSCACNWLYHCRASVIQWSPILSHLYVFLEGKLCERLTLWNCILLGQKLCTVFEIFLYRAGCARSWYRIQISICYFALLYHCLAVWIFCCAVKETLHNCCILNYWFDFLIIIWWPLDFDLSLASVISCYCVACVIVSIPFDVSVCSRQQ